MDKKYTFTSPKQKPIRIYKMSQITKYTQQNWTLHFRIESVSTKTLQTSLLLAYVYNIGFFRSILSQGESRWKLFTAFSLSSSPAQASSLRRYPRILVHLRDPWCPGCCHFCLPWSLIHTCKRNGSMAGVRLNICYGIKVFKKAFIGGTKPPCRFTCWLLDSALDRSMLQHLQKSHS